MTSMPNAVPAALPALRCPKCTAEMAMYERSGVVVDQCRECRGIYLDRGELERLIDAEAALASRAAPAPTREAPRSAPRPAQGPRSVLPWGDEAAAWHDGEDDWRERRDDRHDRNDGRGWDDRGRPPRKRNFLGELLEGFGE